MGYNHLLLTDATVTGNVRNVAVKTSEKLEAGSI